MTRLHRLNLWLAMLALLCAAAPLVAGPAEPLVVTKLPDPDPGYVPPRPEKRIARATRKADENTTLEQAFESLGRISGQVAQIAEQRARERASADVARLEERNREVREEQERTICETLRSARGSGISHPEWERRCGL
jgi:hypothetical protein